MELENFSRWGFSFGKLLFWSVVSLSFLCFFFFVLLCFVLFLINLVKLEEEEEERGKECFVVVCFFFFWQCCTKIQLTFVRITELLAWKCCIMKDYQECFYTLCLGCVANCSVHFTGFSMNWEEEIFMNYATLKFVVIFYIYTGLNYVSVL